MKKTLITLASIAFVILGVAVYSIKVTPPAQVLPENTVATSTISTNPSFPIVESEPEFAATTTKEMATEEVIEPFIAPLPDSFKDVEMTTYKSEFGFEITYPKEWQKNESKKINDDGSLFYSFSPDLNIPENDKWMINPLFWIDVKKTDIKSLRNNVEGTEKFILLNDKICIYFEGSSGVETYEFVEDGYYYIVYLNTVALRESDFIEDEVRWIISTFKIISKNN